MTNQVYVNEQDIRKAVSSFANGEYEYGNQTVDNVDKIRFLLEKAMEKGQSQEENIFTALADYRTISKHSGRKYIGEIQRYSMDRNVIDNQKINPSLLEKGISGGYDTDKLKEYLYGKDNIDNVWATTSSNNNNVYNKINQKKYPSNPYELENDNNIDWEIGRIIHEFQPDIPSYKIKNDSFSCYVYKWGESLIYSEEQALLSNPQLLAQYFSDISRRKAHHKELITMLTMINCSTVVYSGTATSDDSMGEGIGAGAPDATVGKNAQEELCKVNFELLTKVRTILRRLQFPLENMNIDAGPGNSTVPVSGDYIAIVGNEVAADLEKMTKTFSSTELVFTPKHLYPNSKSLINKEIGACLDTRFVRSDLIAAWRGKGATVDDDYAGKLAKTNKKFDIFPILFCSKKAVVNVGLAGYDESITHTTPEENIVYSSRGIGTFIYKFMFGSVVAMPERCLVVKVLATA